MVTGGDITSLAPQAPSALSANAVSYSQIDLSWTDNSIGEDGFKIESKTGSAGVWGQIATVGANETSYADTGLAATTTYYYRVFSYNSIDDSGASNEASAITPAAPASPPIGGGGGGGGCSMSNPEGQINTGRVILVGIFALGLLVWREMRRRRSTYQR